MNVGSINIFIIIDFLQECGRLLHLDKMSLLTFNKAASCLHICFTQFLLISFLDILYFLLLPNFLTDHGGYIRKSLDRRRDGWIDVYLFILQPVHWMLVNSNRFCIFFFRICWVDSYIVFEFLLFLSNNCLFSVSYNSHNFLNTI